MDGSVGYPAYAGNLSNPMVTSALVTARESTVAADAAWGLYQKPQLVLQQPFLESSDIHNDWKPRSQVADLQPNVRSALIEMELFDSLQFTEQRGAKRKLVSCSLHLPALGAHNKLVTITALSDAVFKQQLQLVESFAALRAERTSEILVQVVPQTVHWSSVAGLSPDKHRYTWELIGIGLRFAMMMVMRFKYAFNVQRAWQRSAVIQPMVLPPGHTAYPSGHATEASFVAELLPLLMGDPSHCDARPYGRVDHAGKAYGMARQLNRLALRIAENRVVAGLHYPVDTIAGQVLGIMLARYFVWRTGGTPATWLTWDRLKVGATALTPLAGVDGTKAQPKRDAFIYEQAHVKSPTWDMANPPAPAPAPAPAVSEAPVLKALWTLARREWVRVKP